LGRRISVLSVGLLTLAIGPRVPTTHAASASLRRAASQSTTVMARIESIRRTFHLPAGHPTNAFRSFVTAAAAANDDPLAPLHGGMVVEYGVWGVVISGSAAAVVDMWVFHDGWEGPGTSNLDCTSASAAGCGGHRRAILSEPPIPGARLYIDVATAPEKWQGSSATSVAALLVWTVGAAR
jgi:hypothetical protein